MIKNGDIESAILIMKEVAKWLIDKGQPLWKIDSLTKEKLINKKMIGNYYIAFYKKNIE